MKVLVVDDNPINVEICCEILEGEYQVITAGDGDTAVESARQESPDVVLLDIMLPGIDGYETCRRLRALPSMRRARIVMLSARQCPPSGRKGLRRAPMPTSRSRSMRLNFWQSLGSIKCY